MSPIPEHAFDLVITRQIAAPAEALYRCWTEPALIKQWFVPPPWTIASAAMDVRPEVVPNRRLVFTDAYTEGWVPSAKPFMTAIISFDPEGEHTRYAARVRHWTEASRQQHEAMGFDQGWGICTDQLAALASTLAT